MCSSTPPSAAELLTNAREVSGLTKSALAQAAGTSRSALDQYEKGHRIPRYDTLVRVVRGAGQTLRVTLEPDQPVSVAPTRTLASFVSEADTSDARWTWRMLVSDFVANEFVKAEAAQRIALLRLAPAPTGHAGWDSFAAALAEHLAFHSNNAPPEWVFDDDRFGLRAHWWPVHGELASMRASAMAHSPASFKRRLILIDGRELPKIRR